MTTKEIIKLLPFDQAFKDDLLLRFDSLEPKVVYEVERMIWDMYDAIYEMRLQENIALAMEHAEQGQEKLDENFYTRVKQLTEQQINSGELEKLSEVDLQTARNALASILKEQKPQ